MQDTGESRRYIGIDVGSKGGIGIIDKEGKIIAYCSMPLKSCPTASSETMVDVNAAMDFILDHSANFIIAVEDVHAQFGRDAASTFKLGRNLQAIIDVCEVLRVEYEAIQPKIWQKGRKQAEKGVWIVKDLVYEDGKVDTKATSLNAAKRIWEGEEFLATKRSYTPHDGIVDALLIAEHLRRKYEKLSKQTCKIVGMAEASNRRGVG